MGIIQKTPPEIKLYRSIFGQPAIDADPSFGFYLKAFDALRPIMRLLRTDVLEAVLDAALDELGGRRK